MNDKKTFKKKFFKVVTFLTLSHILLSRTEKRTFQNIPLKKFFKVVTLLKLQHIILLRTERRTFQNISSKKNFLKL